ETFRAVASMIRCESDGADYTGQAGRTLLGDLLKTSRAADSYAREIARAFFRCTASRSRSAVRIAATTIGGSASSSAGYPCNVAGPMRRRATFDPSVGDVCMSEGFRANGPVGPQPFGYGRGWG